MVYVLFTLLGLGFGSFVNVLAMRYNPRFFVFARKRVGGRSHCDGCKRVLSFYELIPILSYVFLRGHCRTCGVRLTFQHFVIELLCGIFGFFIPYFLNHYFGMGTLMFNRFELPFFYYFFILCWLIVFVLWILVVLIDLRYYIIPDELNLLFLILGFLIVFSKTQFEPLFDMRDSFFGSFATLFPLLSGVFTSALFGALSGALLFALLVFGSGGRAMGFGDVKLGFASGFVIGYPDMILAVFLSFIVGGLVGLFMIFFRNRGLKDALPFAPFLGIGFLLTFFFGTQILSGYFSVFPLLY